MSHMFIHKNFENLEKIASENSSNYISAKPFPSIVFDNFFEAELLNKILEDFPKYFQRYSGFIFTFCYHTISKQS